MRKSVKRFSARIPRGKNAMFQKILIANRGEIACRVIRTARKLGIATVAIYSDADARALHVEMADEAVRVGPAASAQSYLNVDAIIKAAKETGAEAIHPGYGFLSENPAFVDAVEEAGLIFIGPSAKAIRAMGLKDAAKALMEKAGVPVVPGYHGDNQDGAFLKSEADRITYPVLIKARAGGGGKGMRRVDSAADFAAALESARREAEASFGDGAVLVEKYMAKPRHIEVQVFGDNHGNAVHLFERDCSLQRRHQKVIEEAPAPGMTEEMRAAMGEAAVKAALTIGYSGAGTVEFIADVSEGLRPDRFFFMEMNTRLQVEHPVTEAITGLDLVEWQLRVASGEALPKRQDELSINGWAFEARLYAEDPARDFLPATGKLALFVPPENARVDSGVRTGDTITPFYDPMIAKIITHGATRDEALNRLDAALNKTRIAGLVTNRQFLSALCNLEAFRTGDVDTGLIGRETAALFTDAQPSDIAFALAALGALDLLDAPEKSDPWSGLRGFRLWGEASRSVLIEHHGERRTVSFTARGDRHFGFAFGTMDIRAHKNGLVRFAIDGRVSEASVSRIGHDVTVQIEGHDTIFHHVLATGAEEDASSESRILSPMPGLVRLVSVVEGASVAKGDPLVTMEAMKMELSLTAPRDGKVASVTVAAGDQVNEGALLVELEEQHG
ncbi:acetyl-CoA carboxylase, biotin carboxylase subunit [Brucella abortus 01-4165]|uniref:Biotin/lipoyl attachment:Biotin-requiring enzyme, attachment site:Carbamoyl-phosphate synthase L chain, ATP-binding:Carbamoyl n=3 Tax=Brucella abortus TaxID=235 RepID=Q2YPN9_BRUA2|nr:MULTISPECIES: acetyl/propionyl/methylcrotonyl-CoA carboxylase subunit alpha [Brucella]ERM85669.1 3-methylcrotonyl-CoA carboxylase subunit alpha [Brucella abortus 82]ERT86011.1 acetyl-CoA carboxylase, biotin carboxylase subunit [Brucella abortus 90-12178]ERT97080.1 acetyl-CoA carboxylase, biotin carboxylase subunit [Brucella abortus 99-9971-135]KFH21433.1 methylcrotonoyl-CoA carboxylase [Brucella abortus LMN1]KFH23893.1 methylcrotonoyl-CoA carboxylase [Brucella abortus LMN2]